MPNKKLAKRSTQNNKGKKRVYSKSSKKTNNSISPKSILYACIMGALLACIMISMNYCEKSNKQEKVTNTYTSK